MSDEKEAVGTSPLRTAAALAETLFDTGLDPRIRELVEVMQTAIASARDDTTPLAAELLEPWPVLERAVEAVYLSARASGVDLVSTVDPTVPSAVHGNERAWQAAIVQRLEHALSKRSEGDRLHAHMTVDVLHNGELNLSLRLEPSRDAPLTYTTKPLDEAPGLAPGPHGLTTAIVVDGHPITGRALCSHLKHDGVEAELFFEITPALEALGERRFGLAVVDADLDDRGDGRVTRHLQSAGTPTVWIVSRELLMNPALTPPHGVLSRPIPWSRLRSVVSRALGRNPTRKSSSSHSEANGEPPSSAVTARILVAEDSAVNRRLMERLVRHAGYRCDTVASGREAVDACREVDYDLVFMDGKMPDLDGYEATRRIRQEMGPAPPIVALTASDTVADRARCEAVGMNDFLAKPVEIDALTELLRRFLG